MTYLRPANKVLNLKRMGSYHQTRLSFMRSLLRLAYKEGWDYQRSHWSMDDKGVGEAVYELHTPHGLYSLLAFGHDLPEEMRSDRVIATAWDATFVLLDGKVSDDDIKRLEAQVPYQESGRLSSRELSMSRANRSVRLWDYMVDILSAGSQPDADKIAEVGYLMRTTAVYGNGKFGAATRFGSPIGGTPDKTAEQNAIMAQPFRVEMLAVWLIRCFSIDWLEHLAKVKGGDKAVSLSQDLRKLLGIGNSTGLGMAPFVINHPRLTHQWVQAREGALDYALSRKICDTAWQDKFFGVCKAAYDLSHSLNSPHEVQSAKDKSLCDDMEKMQQYLPTHDFESEQACRNLYAWAEDNLSLEGQEMLVTLFIECADDIDRFCDSMAGDEDADFFIDGSIKIARVRKILKNNFGWVDEFDFTDSKHRARFWYVSQAKLEPRLGERYDPLEGEGADIGDGQPLGIAYGIHMLKKDIAAFPDNDILADFLKQHPQHRFFIRRILLSDKYAYTEIHDNILSADMMPIDILRFKLSFFGASRFDPRSDRWLRIAMYQGAPFPYEIKKSSADKFDGWVW